MELISNSLVKRTLAMLLTLVILLGLTPMMVSADNGPMTTEEEIVIDDSPNDTGDPEDPGGPEDADDPDDPDDPGDPDDPVDIDDVISDILANADDDGDTGGELVLPDYGGAEFASDHIIVVFQDSVADAFSAASASTEQITEALADGLDELPGELEEVVQLDEKAMLLTIVELPGDLTVEEAVAHYEQSPLVKYAQPNFIYYRHIEEVPLDAGPSEPDGNIESFASDDMLYPQSTAWRPNDPLVGSAISLTSASHLDRIGVFDAWELLRPLSRSKVRVAVIDTQVQMNHPDLTGRLSTSLARNIQSKNWNKESAWRNLDPADYHGTHVAGLIGATSNNGIGSAGVAAGRTNNIVEIIPINAFEWNSSRKEYGGAYTVVVARAIDYAARPGVGARVINMSLGGPPDSQDHVLRQAVDNAYKSGVVVVASAGNINPGMSGLETLTPSDFTNTISVINVTHTTNLTLTNPNANFPPTGWTNWQVNTNPRNRTSCYGSVKNMSGPGTFVWSTVPTNLHVSEYSLGTWSPYYRKGYDVANGTSMSAPVVAGVAAMVRFADPALTPAEVANILYTTVIDVHTAGRDNDTGHGVVNAEAAVRKALPPPVLSLNRSGSHVFAAKAINYGAQTPLTVTASNKGAQATSALTVALSGTNAANFTISTTSLASIAANGNSTFTVVPRTGLNIGSYTATVTVSGSGVIAQSFNVAFTVNRAAGATVQSGPIRDAAVTADRHNSITILPVLPAAANPGGQWVEYAIGKNTTVPTSGWQIGLTFTGLLPNTSYHVFARTAANTSHDAGAVRRTATAIKTLVAPHTISLSRSGTYTFAAANHNYSNRPVQTIKVNNTGRQATGDLNIGISGLDFDSFEIVTPASRILKSIGVNSSREFTIRPKRGLAAGTYTTTVTVSNADVPVRSFNVTFTVKKGAGAGVTAFSGTPSSSSIAVGMVNVNPTTNPGGQSIQYAITTSNATKMPSNLVWQSNNTFTGLRPSTPYYIWARTASNINCNAGTARRSAAITTLIPDHNVRLSKGSTDLTRSGLHTFEKANFNYSESVASGRKLTVTTLNNGSLKLPTGALTVALTGPDATSFTLSESPGTNIQTLALSTIEAGSTAPPFTVVPRNGLPGGTHEATVVVRRTSDSFVLGSFNIRFTVNRLAGAAVSGAPTALNRTPHSITVNAVTSKDASKNPTVQYAITTSTATSAPSNLNWQDAPTFAGLKPLTNYRVWARTVANGNYNAGAAVRSAAIRTGGVELNKTDRHTFTSRSYTNNARDPLSVLIMNRGTQSTGTVTVTLSGAQAGSFTLSSNPSVSSQSIALANVAVGTPASFTVVPMIGIPVGTHNATVTVAGTGGNTFSAKFNVRFVVSRGTGAAVSAVPTALNRTHSSITANTLTAPINPGGQQVEYAISKNTKTPTSGWKSSPIFAGLSSNTQYYLFARTAKNANCNAGAVRRSSGIRTTAPQHAVTLNRTGTYTFPAARLNYGARTPLSVKVTNTGTQPTGMLTISLSGGTASRFEIVSPAGATLTRSMASIAKKSNRSFTIRPKQGLALGTYTDTVTVTGGYDIIASFTVSFTVNRAAGAAVSVPTARDIGTTGVLVNSVTVPSNPFNQTVEYAISTSTKTPTTGWNGSISLTGLNPATTYYIFARTAANTNCDAGAAKRSAAIRTNALDQSISLNRSGTYNFAAATFGYTTRPALLVTVNNTGRQTTNPLTITLSGANPGSFERTPVTLQGIAINGSSSFTIRPVRYLNAGTHTATVTVSGTGLTARTFNVSFTVNRAAGAAVSGAPTVTTRATNSITVSAVTIPLPNSGTQTVQYAISRTTAVPTTGWQAGTTFSSGLLPATTYYVFARSAQNTNYDAGPALRTETRTR